MTIGRCVTAPSGPETSCLRPRGGVPSRPRTAGAGPEGDRSMSRSAGRRGSVLILVLVVLIAALMAPATASAANRPIVEQAKVIVTFHGPPGKQAQRIIEKYGGSVDKTLNLVNGF